jgi:hypothetical protein
MTVAMPAVVRRYFDADSERNIDAIVALFSGEATVIDEGRERNGTAEIREWQTGPASDYEYRVTILGSESLGEDRFRVTARLEGNFPGGTAELNFDFAVQGSQISYLKIAP